MSRTLRALLGLLSVSVAAMAEGEIPDVRFEVDRDRPPVWVSAAAAIDENGHLRRDLFDPYDAEVLSDPAAMPGATVGPCAINRLESPLEEFVDLESLDALVSNASHVFVGAVVDAAPGFLSGGPGTLYGIRLEDTLSSRSLPSEVYLFVAQASIRMHFGTVCSAVGAEAVVPRVGDRVLGFLASRAVDLEGAIYLVRLDRQLIVEREGRVVLPGFLAKDLDGRSLNAIAASIGDMRTRCSN